MTNMLLIRNKISNLNIWIKTSISASGWFPCQDRLCIEWPCEDPLRRSKPWSRLAKLKHPEKICICQREGCRQSSKIHFVSYKYFHHRSSDPTTVWRSWVILVTQSTSPTTITWSPKATFSWARQPMLCSRCNFQFWKLEFDKISLRGFIWHWRPLPPTTESTVAPVRVKCGLGWPFMLKPFSGVSTLNFPCRWLLVWWQGVIGCC